MRLLLDTHLLLWAVARSQRVSSEARSLIEDPANEVYYSAANIWEIAIKSTLRRKDFRVDLPLLLSTLRIMGLTEVSVTAAHAAGISRLPRVHRDPFDRMLVAQSIAEPMTLLTNDAVLKRYGERVRVV